jgi:adenylate kinase
MLVALTGTPGTGKTAVAKVLEGDFEIIYLKDLKEFYREYDEERDSFVVDVDAMREKFEKFEPSEMVILEGHLSHYMPVNIAIVLRCHPDELKKRLEKRGYREEKIRENLDANSIITSSTRKEYCVRRASRMLERAARCLRSAVSTSINLR